jgi:dolichol-phosphate mannosyltransferase
MPLLSVVVPAYNEAENLPVFYERLCAVMAGLGVEWEWVVVDDHSTDGTFAWIRAAAERDPRIRGFRFSRNFGAWTAVLCGYAQARGAAIVSMSSDLQDPPELIPELLAPWRAGAQIVWAVRERRLGETWSTLFFSRLYYLVMRKVAGLRDLPPTGADVYLLDRVVVDALGTFEERNVGVMPLLSWMGFEQARIHYVRQPRLHGRSSWTLPKKIKLFLDSLLGFSYVPIRAISAAGLLVLGLGGAIAIRVLVGAWGGAGGAGWMGVLAAVLLVGGLQLLALGVLGEYGWRAFDEARRRPRWVVQATTGAEPPGR